MEKPLVTIKYRIYSVDEKGMLERPNKDYGWMKADIYEDAESHEAAAKLIEDAGDWGEYIILPVTHSSAR